MEMVTRSAKQFDAPETLFPHEMDMLHAMTGIVTEAGELMDSLKRHLFYGKRIDITNTKEELGDIMWYCFKFMDTIGTDLSEVMQMNSDKLKARYPDGFSREKANNRDASKERAALEKSQNGLTPHPETGETKTADEWAEQIGIAPRTYRERKQKHGNIPEIYLRNLPENIKEIGKNA